MCRSGKQINSLILAITSVAQTMLRKWISSLEDYMPAETKKKLKLSADEAGVQMVKKTIDRDGRTRVCKT